MTTASEPPSKSLSTGGCSSTSRPTHCTHWPPPPWPTPPCSASPYPQPHTYTPGGIEGGRLLHTALLSDFGRIDIVIASDRFRSTARSHRHRNRRRSRGHRRDCSRRLRRHREHLSARGSGAAVAWTTTPELSRLRAAHLPQSRHTPPAGHSSEAISPARSHRGNRRKTYIHLADGDRVDMASFDSDGSLLRLSAKHAASETDALYIIMASLKADCFNPLDDELLLCGNARRPQSLTPLLRRYIRNVMPMIFPSAALRAGDRTKRTIPSCNSTSMRIIRGKYGGGDSTCLQTLPHDPQPISRGKTYSMCSRTWSTSTTATPSTSSPGTAP